MPRTQEIKDGFEDFVDILQRMKPKTEFIETSQAFEAAFKEVVTARRWPQPQSDEQYAPSTFFSPFTENSPFWRSSIEILETLDHYTVFDRHGKYAIYLKNSQDLFGTRVLPKHTDDAIAQLEGQSARNFLYNIVELCGRIEELNKEKRSLRTEKEELQRQLDQQTVGTGRYRRSFLGALINILWPWRR